MVYGIVIMLIQYYLEHYIMPFLNHTCNVKVNYGGKHKHKSQKKLKIQKKALRIINLKTQGNQVKKYIKNPKF